MSTLVVPIKKTRVVIYIVTWSCFFCFILKGEKILLKNVMYILPLFYLGIIQFVLSCIFSWYENATAIDTSKLDKIIKYSKRLGCITISDLDLLYKQAGCRVLKCWTAKLRSCRMFGVREISPLNWFLLHVGAVLTQQLCTARKSTLTIDRI